MNFYTVGIAGMPRLLLEIDAPLENFKRHLYAAAFKTYYEKNLATFEAIEQGYREVVDKEQFLKNMAGALSDAAEEKLNTLTKKSKKDALMMDFNVCLAVYVLPAVQEFKGDSSQALTEAILGAWKERFPRTNVQASTYENINNGFKRKFCYITTAVCETFGKPDDCYELTLFRNYRDSYLAKQPDGEQVIHTYYDLAPTIVKHIEKQTNHRAIYEDIWKTYLEPCKGMIEQGEQEACKELYIKMVRTLQQTYFIN